MPSGLCIHADTQTVYKYFPTMSGVEYKNDQLWRLNVNFNLQQNLEPYQFSLLPDKTVQKVFNLVYPGFSKGFSHSCKNCG